MKIKYRLWKNQGGKFTPQWRYWWCPFWIGIFTSSGRRLVRQSKSTCLIAMRIYIKEPHEKSMFARQNRNRVSDSIIINETDLNHAIINK